MAIFDEKIEIRERPLVFTFSGLFCPGPFFPIFRQWIPQRCKGVHCVDLGESFPTRIYLQKSASIQPRTSPSKFGGKFNSLFTSLLSCDSFQCCPLSAVSTSIFVSQHPCSAFLDICIVSHGVSPTANSELKE